MNHLAENTVSFTALRGPGFEARLGIGEPQAQIQCERRRRRVSAKWSFLLECFAEQMGFYEFSEVCYSKSKLLSRGFFLSPYILISLFVFGAYELARRFPLELGILGHCKLPSRGSPLLQAVGLGEQIWWQGLWPHLRYCSGEVMLQKQAHCRISWETLGLFPALEF